MIEKIREAISKHTKELNKPTDIVMCSITAKKLKQELNLIYFRYGRNKNNVTLDLRLRKKPIGNFEGLDIWIDGKLKMKCYIINKNNAINMDVVFQPKLCRLSLLV